jgi:hypothetical protein
LVPTAKSSHKPAPLVPAATPAAASVYKSPKSQMPAAESVYESPKSQMSAYPKQSLQVAKNSKRSKSSKSAYTSAKGSPHKTLDSAYGSSDDLKTFKGKVENRFTRHLLAPMYYAYRKTKRKLFGEKPKRKVKSVNPVSKSVYASARSQQSQQSKIEQSKKEKLAMWLDVVKFALEFGRTFKIVMAILAAAIQVIERSEGKTAIELNDLFFKSFVDISMEQIHGNKELSADTQKMCEHIVNIIARLKPVLFPFVGFMIHKLAVQFQDENSHLHKDAFLNKDYIVKVLRGIHQDLSDDAIYLECQLILHDYISPIDGELNHWILAQFTGRALKLIKNHPELLLDPAFKAASKLLAATLNAAKNVTDKIKNAAKNTTDKIKTGFAATYKKLRGQGGTRKRR